MRSIKLFFCFALMAMMPSIANAQSKNIVETAVGAGNFNTLVTAVKAAGLAGTLSGGEFTVFAPTDEAFSKLDPALVANLLKPENKAQLAAVLTYHVVPGRVTARTAYGLSNATTVNGQRLNVDLQSDTPMINKSRVVATDIMCSNGVIHVIDEVMLPALENIPTVATNAGSFNTLVAAVGAAGLGEVLSGPGPFTVFAPTDEAFQKLPAGTVENLLLPENKQKLIDILKYHVVSGRVYDTDAVKAGTAQTLLGRSVRTNFTSKGITINDAVVVAKNVGASNGVIHAIDSVLLPTSMGRGEAMSMMNDAINRGAPVFNAGRHGQCCEIYTSTMMTLQSSGIEGADGQTMQMISSTLSNAANTHNDTERAWALRRGMDSLYSRVSQMPQTFSTQMPMGNGTIVPTLNGG